MAASAMPRTEPGASLRCQRPSRLEQIRHSGVSQRLKLSGSRGFLFARETDVSPSERRFRTSSLIGDNGIAPWLKCMNDRS